MQIEIQYVWQTFVAVCKKEADKGYKKENFLEHEKGFKKFAKRPSWEKEGKLKSSRQGRSEECTNESKEAKYGCFCKETSPKHRDKAQTSTYEKKFKAQNLLVRNKRAEFWEVSGFWKHIIVFVKATKAIDTSGSCTKTAKED